MEMKTDERLLSIPEFSQMLRVTPACTRRWLLERKIKYVKVGRLVRISQSEVSRIIAEGRRPARIQSARP
jgi:excisionase family DNA binding protein